MPSTACVITSIRDPHETSVKDWCEHFDTVYFVPDEKTPPFVNDLPGLIIVDRNVLDDSWAPKNSYARKNLGYLAAAQDGFAQVFETDDDNYPCDGVDYSEQGVAKYATQPQYFDLYLYANIRPAIQRGLPLTHTGNVWTIKLAVPVKGNVTQFWCYGEPDSWACERLARVEPVSFGYTEFEPVALGESSFSPLNTQMTLIDLDLIDAMYIPHTCQPRATDILRGWILQSRCFDRNMDVVFDCRGVHQVRNDHDLVQDHKDEWDLHTKWYGQGDLDEMIKAGLCKPEEMDMYERYLKEIEQCA